MDDLLHCYKILGLKPGASFEEVQKAYRDAAWLWHPDRFPNEPYIQEKAQARIRDINAAYQQLKTHFLGKEAEATDAASPAADAGMSETETGPSPPPAGEILSRVRTARVWVREHAAQVLIGLAVAAGLLLSPLIYAYLRAPSMAPAPVTKETAPAAPDAGPFQGEKAAPRAATPAAGPVAGRRAIPPPPAASRYFTLGSSQDEVWALQGPPQRILGNTWKYGLSWVTFKNRRVVSYLNISRNLRVRLAPAAVAGRPSYFTVGSSKDRVLAVQGTPTGVVGNSWKYGESEVKFRGERVVCYTDTGHNLEVTAPSRTRTARKAWRNYFSLGSTKRRVLAVQGYPTYVWGNTWWYGYSRVNFYDDRVINFANFSGNLKARFF